MLRDPQNWPTAMMHRLAWLAVHILQQRLLLVFGVMFGPLLAGAAAFYPKQARRQADCG